LLGKANHTTYIRSTASDVESQRESDFSEVTQFYARYVNETLLSKATINISITHVACGDALRQAI